MSISQLIEHQGVIIAVNDNGSLILWDLNQLKRIQGVYVFKDNISLLPSKGSIRIDKNSLKGLKYFNNTVIMFNLETVYVTTFQYIIQGVREERIKNISTISCLSFFEKKEIINCLSIVSNQSILIGTNKGNIYHYDFLQRVIISRTCIGNQQKPQGSQLTIFATVQKAVNQVNSMQIYEQFVLVGLSSGKAYSLRVQNLQKIFQITANSNQNLQSIQKIIFSKDHQKIYFLHQDYITEWSLKLGACLSYIDYSHAKDLLVKNDKIIIIGNHSKLIWFDGEQKQYNLSMRSARTICQISNDLIAVGGSDGIIDIMLGGMRLMTIFHQNCQQ